MLIRTIVSLDPTLLAQALARMAGGIALPIEHLGRLSGGANMESWSFDWGGGGYVLRRAPSAEMMDGRPFGHESSLPVPTVLEAAPATLVRAVSSRWSQSPSPPAAVPAAFHGLLRRSLAPNNRQSAQAAPGFPRGPVAAAPWPPFRRHSAGRTGLLATTTRSGP